MQSKDLIDKIQRANNQKSNHQSHTTKKPDYESRASFLNHLDQNYANLTNNVKATINMQHNNFTTPKRPERYHNNLHDNHKKSPIDLHHNNDLINGHLSTQKNKSISYNQPKNEVLSDYYTNRKDINININLKTISNNYGNNFITNNIHNNKNKYTTNNNFQGKERSSYKNLSSVNSQFNRYNYENDPTYDMNNNKYSTFYSPNRRMNNSNAFHPKKYMSIQSQNVTPKAEFEILKKEMMVKSNIDSLERNRSNSSLKLQTMGKSQKFFKDNIQVLDTLDKNRREKSGDKLSLNVQKNSILARNKHVIEMNQNHAKNQNYLNFFPSKATSNRNSHKDAENYHEKMYSKNMATSSKRVKSHDFDNDDFLVKRGSQEMKSSMLSLIEKTKGEMNHLKSQDTNVLLAKPNKDLELIDKPSDGQKMVDYRKSYKIENIKKTKKDQVQQYMDAIKTLQKDIKNLHNNYQGSPLKNFSNPKIKKGHVSKKQSLVKLTKSPTIKSEKFEFKTHIRNLSNEFQNQKVSNRIETLKKETSQKNTINYPQKFLNQQGDYDKSSDDRKERIIKRLVNKSLEPKQLDNKNEPVTVMMKYWENNYLKEKLNSSMSRDSYESKNYDFPRGSGSKNYDNYRISSGSVPSPKYNDAERLDTKFSNFIDSNKERVITGLNELRSNSKNKSSFYDHIKRFSNKNSNVQNPNKIRELKTTLRALRKSYNLTSHEKDMLNRMMSQNSAKKEVMDLITRNSMRSHARSNHTGNSVKDYNSSTSPIKAWGKYLNVHHAAGVAGSHEHIKQRSNVKSNFNEDYLQKYVTGDQIRQSDYINSNHLYKRDSSSSAQKNGSDMNQRHKTKKQEEERYASVKSLVFKKDNNCFYHSQRPIGDKNESAKHLHMIAQLPRNTVKEQTRHTQEGKLSKQRSSKNKTSTERKMTSNREKILSDLRNKNSNTKDKFKENSSFKTKFKDLRQKLSKRNNNSSQRNLRKISKEEKSDSRISTHRSNYEIKLKPADPSTNRNSVNSPVDSIKQTKKYKSHKDSQHEKIQENKIDLDNISESLNNTKYESPQFNNKKITALISQSKKESLSPEFGQKKQRYAEALASYMDSQKKTDTQKKKYMSSQKYIQSRKSGQENLSSILQKESKSQIKDEYNETYRIQTGTDIQEEIELENLLTEAFRNSKYQSSNRDLVDISQRYIGNNTNQQRVTTMGSQIARKKFKELSDKQKITVVQNLYNKTNLDKEVKPIIYKNEDNFLRLKELCDFYSKMFGQLRGIEVNRTTSYEKLVKKIESWCEPMYQKVIMKAFLNKENLRDLSNVTGNDLVNYFLKLKPIDDQKTSKLNNCYSKIKSEQKKSVLEVSKEIDVFISSCNRALKNRRKSDTDCDQTTKKKSPPINEETIINDSNLQNNLQNFQEHFKSWIFDIKSQYYSNMKALLEKKQANTKNLSSYKTQRKSSKNEINKIGLKNGLKGQFNSNNQIENEIGAKIQSLRKSGINLDKVNKNVVENNRIVRNALNSIRQY